MKIYHNHEAQSSRGTKGGRDEEHIRTPQTLHMNTDEQTKNNCNRERSVEKNYLGLKLILLVLERLIVNPFGERDFNLV